MTTVHVVTKNAPARYGQANNKRDFQRLANRRKVSVIAGQEIPDAAADDLCPAGWCRWRPERAKSEVIYWDPAVWECVSVGAFQISSDDAPAPRFIVWALLEHRKTGERVRFGCAHMVAFKTSSEAHAEEYRYQADRVAVWLARGGKRVLLGDMNGSPGGPWLAPVMEVAKAQRPATKSGPHGDFIDLVLTNHAAGRATRARALRGYHGDHKPVVASLSLN